MFLNGTTVGTAPVLLQADTNYRFKFERQHENFDEYHRLKWLGPHPTAAEATQASNNDFALVASQHFLHEVLCSDGCSGRGCCVADGRCQCEPGYGGASCELLLETCADGPSGELMPGGLRARYFASRTFETVAMEKVEDVFLTGSTIPNIDLNHFSVRWIGRLRPKVTGMHFIGHTSNTRAVVRIILGGAPLYDWDSSWASFFFFIEGETYDIAVEFRYVASKLSQIFSAISRSGK